MIITAPTGLYRSILPQSPSDAGNYTFTISNNSPPRSGDFFVQLPSPELFRQAPDRVYSKLQKRAFYGDLIFDITASGPGTTGNGTDQFEIGQVLEFSEEETESADPFELNKIELRQDLKVIDFESAGLDQKDFNELVNASENRLEELSLEIAEISTDLKSNADSISANQASINNSSSLLNNIVAILGEESLQANKVKNNLELLRDQKADLLAERESLQSQLNELRNEQQIVREVVR